MRYDELNEKNKQTLIQLLWLTVPSVPPQFLARHLILITDEGMGLVRSTPPPLPLYPNYSYLH